MYRSWYWQSARSLERRDQKSCSSHYTARSTTGKRLLGRAPAGHAHGIPKPLYFLMLRSSLRPGHPGLQDKVSPRTMHPAHHHTGTKPGVPKVGCREAVPGGTQDPRAWAGQGSSPPESSTAKAHCSGQREREQTARWLCSPQRQRNVCSGESVEAKTRSVRPE